MKFIIYTAPKVGSRTFYSSPDGFLNVSEEEYVKPITDPVKWGKEIVQYYNSTLRKGERPRAFLGARIITHEDTSHDWRKSCLVTQFRHHTSFDTYECKKCGITGKRYGLQPFIVRDDKYKANKFEECHPGTK